MPLLAQDGWVQEIPSKQKAMPPLDHRTQDRPAPFWLLAATTMTGTAALHGLIPVLPAIALEFGVTQHTAQYAITLYLVGMALGQLVYGPLSDRFGRRPLLLCSQAIYAAGLLLAAVAPQIGVLLAARVLQSLGSSGALVLGRAMVRDVSGSADAARQLATLGLVMALTPALAPVLGGLVGLWLGWRAIFLLLALVVCGLSFLVMQRLPETNRTPVPLPGVAAILMGYVTLWRSPVFRRFTMAGACSATSLYGFLAAAPFLLTRWLHQPPASVGFYCLLTVAGMMAGTVVARQVAPRVGIVEAARMGNGICVAAAALLALVCVTGALSLGAMMTLLVIYALGIGIASPNCLAGLMNAHPERAGAASSLYGFLQMVCGAAFTLFVSASYIAPGFPVALSLLVASGLAAVSLAGLQETSRPA